MILCSALLNECMPPARMEKMYNNNYECMLAGYEEAIKKTKEIGKKDIDTYQGYVKFVCTPQKEEITLPKSKIET